MVQIVSALFMLLFVLLLASLGWWWTGPSSDELVVYPAACMNGTIILPSSLAIQLGQDGKSNRADRANCEILPLNRTVYKLNKARAEVYYTLSGQAVRLVDCAFFSRNNWSCSYPDGSGKKVVIIDGLRAFHADEVSSSGVGFSLRRWQWWAVTLYGVIDERPRGAWLIPEQHQYYLN